MDRSHNQPCILRFCRLVMITFLQHTHINLPHYDDKEWDWLRGALATVDRCAGCGFSV